MSKPGRNKLCHCGSKKKYKKCHLERDAMKASVVRRIEQKQITRKDFIGGPYKACPACSKNRFGVWFGTGGDSYGRECEDCGHTKGIKLPPLRKRIIYLDQFFISNIAKVLDTKARGHAATAADPFWLEAFKKLDKLHQMNLIVCPDSFFHTDESLLSGDPSYKSLRAVYERLSHGSTFYDHNTIMRFQVGEHAKNYLSGEPNKATALTVENMMMGHGLHEWTGKMRVAVNMKPYEGQVDAIRKERDNLYEAIRPIFERWQKEKGRDFMEWVREEANAFGKGTIQAYLKHLKKRAELPQKYAEQVLAGIEPEISLDDVLPPPSADIMQQIDMEVRRHGLEGDEALKKTVEYLQSPTLIDIPANHISALLYAGIARKAANGQRTYPNKGTFTDVNAISSLMPYCNVMFIDNAMATLLQESPINSEVARYDTRIFSMNSKQDFLTYLDEIESSATSEHLALVEDYFGECEPYLDFVKHVNEED